VILTYLALAARSASPWFRSYLVADHTMTTLVLPGLGVVVYLQPHLVKKTAPAVLNMHDSKFGETAFRCGSGLG
jgi:hypothetical protein